MLKYALVCWTSPLGQVEGRKSIHGRDDGPLHGSRVDGALARTFWRFAALVGCGHVSGLLVRQVWPLALMLCADRVPNKIAHFGRGALTQAGSPDPRNDRICITSSCPRQLVF